MKILFLFQNRKKSGSVESNELKNNLVWPYSNALHLIDDRSHCVVVVAVVVVVYSNGWHYMSRRRWDDNRGQ